MPALANPRRERFCIAYIKTGCGAKAYRAAGYRAANPHVAAVGAHDLLTFPDVKSRTSELRRKMSYRQRVTVESLLQDVTEDRALARSLNQPGAALQATTLMAKLVGLLVDRKETGQPGDFASLESPEAIVAKVRADLGDSAADALQALLGAAVETAPLSDTPAAPDDSLN